MLCFGNKQHSQTEAVGKTLVGDRIIPRNWLRQAPTRGWECSLSCHLDTVLSYPHSIKWFLRSQL